MRKYIGILSILLLSTLSCVDVRYDSMIDDSIYFIKSDLQEQTVIVMSSNDFVYPIWVHKGGYYQEQFDGAVELDTDYLTRYNAQAGTSYQMLDEKYFEFNPNFSINKGSNEVSVPLTLKTETILSELGFGVYYIPMKVLSRSEGKTVNAEKENILVACSFRQASLSIDGTNKREILLDLTNETAERYTIDITAALDVESAEELSVDYSIDASLASAGAKLLAEGYFSFESSVSILKDKRYGENFLNLELASMPAGKWTIPVKLSSANSKIAIADDAYLVLTVVKGVFEGVTWASDYLQEGILQIPGEGKSALIVGTVNKDDVTLVASEAWVQPVMDGNTIKVSISNNPGTVNRTAVVTVIDNETLLESKITVSQTLPGFGILVNKGTWTVINNSANCDNKKADFWKMYDGLWRKDKAGKDSYTELTGRSDNSVPYVLTFDMGALRSCNSFGFMPRQQWSAPSPKQIKVEVSVNGTDWVTVGKNQGVGGILSGYTENELKVNGSYNDIYNAKVKWFDFAQKEEVRYFRVSFYETFWTNVLCIEEIFISLR